MRENAMILIPRLRNNTKELLFIRPHGKNFLQFPLIATKGNETIKTAIKRTLLETIGLTVSSISKETVIVFQPIGESVIILKIYKTEVLNAPKHTDYVEEFHWLTEYEVKKRISHMSPKMQEYVLPRLEEEDLWS